MPFDSKMTQSPVLSSVLKITAIVGLSSLVTLLTFRALGGLSLSIHEVSTQKNNTFDVTGRSQISVIPDEARVTLGVSVSDSSVESAQSTLNQKLDTIIKALTELGIPKDSIKTTNYSINPQYDFRPESQRQITAYFANTTIEMKLTDFNKLSQAISAATAAGANEVNGIQFGLSEDLEAKTRRQAREEAINQAKEEAKDLAGLADMRLGKIINVIETAPFEPPIYSTMAKAEGLGGGADMPAQLEPGNSIFSYQVILSYETH
jgi:uncharacterized protein